LKIAIQKNSLFPANTCTEHETSSVGECRRLH
jgi:hypothetical protein